MPKYYNFKIAGYFLYFTTKCVLECFHVHASDKDLTVESSAKFFVKENGDSVIQKRGILKDKELRVIQDYIKEHYQEMYAMWQKRSKNGFYRGE